MKPAVAAAMLGPALLLAWPSAMAQSSSAAPGAAYPSRAVRIVVPTSPGGGTDLVGRVLAQRLTEALGQPVIVENRGGAGTTIGTAIVAKAPPDGHVLLFNHFSIAFNASYYRKLPYDTLKDFAPVTTVATQPFLMVAHPSLPVKSVKELVALAKKRPGQLAYASGGPGSGPHMSTELLKLMAKIDVLQVPYKGAGPAFIDLVSGQVQMMIATMSLAVPHVKEGRARALAITSLRRHPSLPELPTVDESGVPGYQFEVWYGLYAPAGTPAAVVQKLNAATIRALQAPETREKLAGEGLEPTGSTPAEIAALLRRDVEVWAKVVKAMGEYAD